MHPDLSSFNEKCITAVNARIDNDDGTKMCGLYQSIRCRGKQKILEPRLGADLRDDNFELFLCLATGLLFQFPGKGRHPLTRV